MKNEDIFENKGFFIYGFEHVKTDKIDIYILIECESDELYENDKLFNFWSNKFINKELEIRNFKLTVWSFMTLVKRNNFFKFQSNVCSWFFYSLSHTKNIYMSLWFMMIVIISIYY